MSNWTASPSEKGGTWYVWDTEDPSRAVVFSGTMEECHEVVDLHKLRETEEEWKWDKVLGARAMTDRPTCGTCKYRRSNQRNGQWCTNIKSPIYLRWIASMYTCAEHTPTEESDDE